MEEETKDVTPIEGETVDSSTTEQETSQPVEEVKSEENAIPHSRVKEMVSKARDEAYQKALKELTSEELKEELQKEELPEVDTGETEQAEQILDKIIGKHLEPVKKQMAQQQVEKFLDSTPDAVNYIDKIKDLRKGNKALNWDDAYKLASFDDKMKQSENNSIEQKEADRTLKQSAQTEKPTAAKQEAPKSLGEKMTDRSIPLSELEADLKRIIG